MDTVIGKNDISQRIMIACLCRLISEMPYSIRPAYLGTNALLAQCLHAVADHSAIVFIGGALKQPGIVVNKQPAEVAAALRGLALQKLEVADKRVGCAAADRPLVAHRRAPLTQIDPPGKMALAASYVAIEVIAVIGRVGPPAIPSGGEGRRRGGGHG
jgi:hypothetical protein